MGKYMRKAKITADIAVMEVSQSSLGVRTRAKTLALQRLQTTPPTTNSELSYLQLRNRRLEKPPLQSESKKNQQQKTMENENCKQNPSLEPGHGSRLRITTVTSDSVGSVSVTRSNKELGLLDNCSVEFRNGEKTEDINNFSAEASFGENNLEIESRGRSTRESTPCSFIRGDSDPGSTTRPISSNASDRRTLSSVHRIIPTAREMEEFFASAEQQQQRLFTEKYNYDFVNDLPLPGRYEWMRVQV